MNRPVRTAAAAAVLFLGALSTAPTSAPAHATGPDGTSLGCPLERIGAQFVKCDDLTGAGAPAPSYVDPY